MITGQTLILIFIGLTILAIFIWGPSKIPQWVKAILQAKYEFEKAKKGELEEKSREESGRED